VHGTANSGLLSVRIELPGSQELLTRPLGAPRKKAENRRASKHQQVLAFG
jgi:hypothetical protein